MIKLRFNESIKHDLAVITIYDNNKKPVFTGNPNEDIDRSPLLEFSLPSLNSGRYLIQWNIVSSDGHPVSSSSTFTIGKETEGGKLDAKVDGMAEKGNFPSLKSIWKKGAVSE